MKEVPVNLDDHHDAILVDDEIRFDALIADSTKQHDGKRREWDTGALQRIVEVDFRLRPKSQSIVLARGDIRAVHTPLVGDALSANETIDFRTPVGIMIESRDDP